MGMSQPEKRLGYDGDADAIKRHPFLAMPDETWEQLLRKDLDAPFKPATNKGNVHAEASVKRAQDTISETAVNIGAAEDHFKGFEFKRTTNKFGEVRIFVRESPCIRGGGGGIAGPSFG